MWLESMVSKKYKGYIGEKLAEDWLKNRGFKIVYKNLKVGKIGEVDLVCEKDGVHYFVEVKSSFNYDLDFPPEFHFNKSKFMKIVKMANLIANKQNFSRWKIALLTISKNSKNVKLKFYKNV
jgi:putative endonuclease